MADNFKPEFVEPDELISVAGVLYGVIYMQVYDVEGNKAGLLPIYLKVDNPDMLNPGHVIDATYDSIDALDEANGEFVFIEHWQGMSELMTVQELENSGFTTTDALLSVTQNQMEIKAKFYGDHYLDLDMLYAYGLSALLDLDTVPIEILQETSFYKDNPTDSARAWIEYENRFPDEAASIIADNLAYYKLFSGGAGLAGEGVNDLIAELNTAVITGKLDEAVAGDIIKNLGDSARLKLMGGKSIIPEEYHQYIGKIKQTRNGYAAAELLILDYGGPLLLDGYRTNGKLDEIASKLRLDAEFNTSTNETLIKEDLQKAADALYPFAKGSKYGNWGSSFESLTRNILGQTTLSEGQKLVVARKAQKFQGNYEDFETSMYQEYIDTPFVQEEILTKASRSLTQDISGVFNASTIYKR
tara:strand:+ start:15892 stop:17136 length:1245 start_codon:yes stop_codon:yes gene_type:complete